MKYNFIQYLFSTIRFTIKRNTCIQVCSGKSLVISILAFVALMIISIIGVSEGDK